MLNTVLKNQMTQMMPIVKTTGPALSHPYP